MDNIDCSNKSPLEFDPDNFYAQFDYNPLNAANKIKEGVDSYAHYIKCPNNIYFAEFGCPIPVCQPGYIPVPYHCKFDNKLIEADKITVQRNPGERLGLKLTLDTNFNFILNTTVKFNVLDKFT